MKTSIGERYNKWTVVSDVVRIGDVPKVVCRCECGTEKAVNLVRGLSKNCGCGRKATISALVSTHGAGKAKFKKSKAASSYKNMLNRCNNPNYRDYPNWGGRGIIICERWLGKGGFENFLADMGEPPAGMWIERKDNDGNYEPDNCKWASPKEQMNNQRNSRRITIGGVTKTLSQWSDESGLTRHAIDGRLRRDWPPERLLEPLKQIYWRRAA